MCGLVAGIGERNLVPVLVEGLHRLEYRGYDSAGVAVVNDRALSDLRAIGKVAALEQRIEAAGLEGPVGIAHTRWATHGAPTEENAHPHRSRDGRVAIVHNGIIENHGDLRSRLDAAGWPCVSATDSEVIAHRLEQAMALGSSPLDAMRSACAELQGAYAIAAVFADFPDELIVARSGSPVLLGLGIGETFAASDVQALLPVTQRFVDLEDGDIARLTRDGVEIHDAAGERVERGIRESRCQASIADRGEYRHFMLKEIYEQPHALEQTLSGRLGEAGILENILGPGSDERLADVAAVQIVACGTSYHAGMVAAHWIEEHLGLPARVEVASEYRYRRHVLAPGTLLVVISQSGETADTLAVLRQSQDEPFLARLAICNVPESTMARAADLVLMTHAGPEIGVASTKAFTTQLAALAILVLLLGQVASAARMPAAARADAVAALRSLPDQVARILALDTPIARIAEDLMERQHALFLGRGAYFPIALEGALKLKEISYIHAEAYPSGELKHGPLALVDTEMPVVAVAPDDAQLEKLSSNLQEVRARGGQLIVIGESNAARALEPEDTWVGLPQNEALSPWLAPVLFTVPLQLLAYHTAVLKGTDVDQPRNLAKSVTVE
ncbi:glucosamine--fructose-6-phosphate aminotransferase [Thioalkalivibrio versutus]|uniref:Glutamine--fructose-6-phosphate aminotransferase [isomerizing] n=1 Tax=Thioalkalivibrio versutus TaxID=106634 RepID=A0A0G3G519_9GAMM|nr:glutamine--fructose-6-phosphate transaminase (isomerizing) [Thioalkalivibrio versutus]AKJ96333.1 glucosamine--fructose-6-phosphate aminotransferase [Thioalkalivibrio versutus]